MNGNPDDGESTSIAGHLTALLFRSKGAITAIGAALLVTIAMVRNYGVILGGALVLLGMVVGLRHGSLAELGFRRPMSWRRTLLVGVVLGVVIQLVFSVIVDPAIETATGSAIDLSVLDPMRGDLPTYLVMLGIGWAIGGFLEEILFRGYLLGRISRILGRSVPASVVAVALPAISFGMAHRYQDAAGMISTGLFGLLLGVVYLVNRCNLWLPIVVHGVFDTVGITLIYLDADMVLRRLLF